MSKFVNPSGFAENLPPEQIVEDGLKVTFQDVAESYGYTHLETASVEYMETLASKGDIDKEIFTIQRALSEDDSEEAARGLHFDLTVPFARYVAQHQGELHFPFRRYQVQKVWRGERPQKGRFREFYQADIDVVARETLSLDFDAEVALVMAKVLSSFKIGALTMRINNRKFLNGLFETHGIEFSTEVLQIVDKIDKIGSEEAKRMLREDQGLDATAVAEIFTILGETVLLDDAPKFLDSITQTNVRLDEGKAELLQLFSVLQSVSIPDFAFTFSPSIARGLDYYTGMVCEVTINGHEKYGSICSGGRYADLAGRFTNQKLPGVGMSIGLTRLLTAIREESLLDFSRKVMVDLTVCLPDEDRKSISFTVAETLRDKGLNIEMNYKHDTPLGKQLEAVHSRNIPYALVCELDGKLTLYTMVADGNAEKSSFDSPESLAEFLRKS
jgi:histidyl-tRNA synthetase